MMEGKIANTGGEEVVVKSMPTGEVEVNRTA